jgi:hypothetical protein
MEREIYIYTTNTYRKNGWYKFGQTTQTSEVRVKQQDGTSNPEELKLIHNIPSVVTDTYVHKQLELLGYSKCRHNREWFEGFSSDDEAITVLNKIISESEKDTRPTYKPRFYQDYINLLFLYKLKNLNIEEKHIDFALELAPRFGKTIWSIDLIKTLFTDFGYKICFLPAYVLTALSSFKKDFYHFNGYSDGMVYVSKDDDVVGVIKENYGKKMIIVETSLHVNDYEGKLDFVKDLPPNEKVCFMDEADFGTHRGNSQEVIRFIDAKLNVYMTGTAIERVTNPLENLEDNVIRWSYTDMLMVKKGEHPIQKYLAEV